MEMAVTGAEEERGDGGYLLRHEWLDGKTLTGKLVRDKDGLLCLFKKVKARHHLAKFGGWGVNRAHALAAAEDGAVRVTLRDEHGREYRAAMNTVLSSALLPQLGRVRDLQYLVLDKNWDTPEKGIQQSFL